MGDLLHALTSVKWERTFQTLVAAAFAGLAALLGGGAVAAEPIQLVRSETSMDSAINGMVLADVYAQAGLKMVVTPLPAARASTESQTGSVDGEVSRVGSFGDTRPMLVRLEPPVSQLSWVAVYRKSSQVTIKSPADLKKYSVAYIRGYKGAEAMLDGAPNVIPVSNSEQLLKVLAAGNADVMVEALTSLNMETHRQNINSNDLVKVELLNEPLYHYLHEKNRKLVPVISGILSKLSKSGKLATMRDKAEKEFIASARRAE